MFLNRLNLLIAKLAEKASSRFTPSAVMADAAVTAATDGHALIVVSRPPAPEEPPPIEHFNREEGTLLIPRDVAIGLAKRAKKSKGCIVQLGRNGSAEKRAAAIGTDEIVHFDQAAGTFPNYNAVMPNHRDAVFTISVDPRLLSSVCDMLNEIIDKQPPIYRAITLRFYGPDKAIRLDALNEETGQTATAVLMPMRDPEIKCRDFHPVQSEQPVEATQ